MTRVADPALRFWLRHVAAAGGLWEPDGDTTYVVLPAPLRDAYRLPEELRVTADPDVGGRGLAGSAAAGDDLGDGDGDGDRAGGQVPDRQGGHGGGGGLAGGGALGEDAAGARGLGEGGFQRGGG